MSEAVLATGLAPAAPPITVPGSPPILEELFSGTNYAAELEALKRDGVVRHSKGELRVQTRLMEDGRHEVLAIATVARDPGVSNDYVQRVQDFQVRSTNQAQKARLLWEVYRNEGLINNAINKVASILASACTFKVRKARKGKVQTAKEQLEEAINQWRRKVNTAGPEAIATGTRGHSSINFELCRYALIEGSWYGRGVWTKRELPGLKGQWSMPWTIQTITTEQLEVDQAYLNTGIDRILWRPPSQLLSLLKSRDPVQRKDAEQFLSKEMRDVLKTKGQVSLDPSLLLHCKHRGKTTEAFGDSIITPAMPSLAYVLSLHQLDVVCMQNLINRLTIVKVGSADPKSPYSRPEVAAARQALMQTFFADPGPNMTLVWAGDDVSVTDVGAHSTVLDLESRFKYGRDALKESLGVPDAILTGRSTDGSNADWAATVGATSNLSELASNVAGMWTTLAERMADENGFVDVDVVCEFNESLMIDRTKERTQNRSDYIVGLRSIRSCLATAGVDPEAEYLQMLKEKNLPEGTSWVEAFAPPQGLQGQGVAKDPGAGRTPNNEQSGNNTTPTTTTE